MFKLNVILSEFELVYWTYTIIIFMHGLFFCITCHGGWSFRALGKILTQKKLEDKRH